MFRGQPFRVALAVVYVALALIVLWTFASIVLIGLGYWHPG